MVMFFDFFAINRSLSDANSDFALLRGSVRSFRAQLRTKRSNHLLKIYIPEITVFLMIKVHVIIVSVIQMDDVISY